MSLMVISKALVPRVASPVGLDKVKVNVSLVSTTVSLRIGTVIVLFVSLAAKVKMPVVAVKSEPAVATPLVEVR